MTRCKFDLAMWLLWSKRVRQFDEQEISLKGTPQTSSSTLAQLKMSHQRIK